MTYFWNPPGKKIGVNADVERHREEEAKLLARIEEIERKLTQGSSDDPIQHRMLQAALRTYHFLLAKLQQSKAEAVSKIGRKK